MAGETTIFYLLANATAVTAIVGSSPVKRIYPLRMPQERNYPAITYRQLTTVPSPTKDAVSGLDKVDFDVDLWAKKMEGTDGMLTLAAAVRAALDGKALNTQGDNVNRIVFVREIDSYDDRAELYHKTQQYRLIIIR